MVTCDEISNLLKTQFEGSKVEVTNPRGDDVHFKIKVIYEGFKGITRIAQHKLVYNVLGGEFGKCGQSLHAIEIVTKVE